eukprot:Trichotokara_eunicae@DN9590_c0_g1_i1.p1
MEERKNTRTRAFVSNKLLRLEVMMQGDIMGFLDRKENKRIRQQASMDGSDDFDSFSSTPVSSSSSEAEDISQDLLMLNRDMSRMQEKRKRRKKSYSGTRNSRCSNGSSYGWQHGGIVRRTLHTSDDDQVSEEAKAESVRQQEEKKKSQRYESEDLFPSTTPRESTPGFNADADSEDDPQVETANAIQFVQRREDLPGGAKGNIFSSSSGKEAQESEDSLSDVEDLEKEKKKKKKKKYSALI